MDGIYIKVAGLQHIGDTEYTSITGFIMKDIHLAKFQAHRLYRAVNLRSGKFFVAFGE